MAKKKRARTSEPSRNYQQAHSLLRSKLPLVISAKGLGLALAFALIFMVADRGIARLLASVTHLHASTPEAQEIQNVLSANNEAYIFGSSRAKHHYDPTILQQESGVRFYNAGAEGQDIMYLRMLADLIEKDHQPKLYLVNLSFSDLMKSSYRFKRVSIFRPYVGQSPVIQRLLKRFDTHWYEIHRWVHSYDYNTQLGGLLTAPLAMPLNNGYQPLRRSYDPADNLKQFRLAAQIDEFVLRELVAFIRQAQSKHIQVVLSVGPTYRYYSDFTLSPADWFLLNGIRQTAKVMHVPYIEIPEISDIKYRSPDFYADVEHLNEKGASYYSHQVGQQLRGILRLQTPDDLARSPYSPGTRVEEYKIPMSIYAPAPEPLAAN